MRSERPAARPLVVGLLLVLALLAGCGPEPAVEDPRSADPGSGDRGSDERVQRRLADALRAQGDASDARLVEDTSTTVDVVKADWLSGWQVLDVLNRGVPHGRRFFVGLADDGRVERLAGRPDAFAAMVTAAGVEVTGPTTAAAVARLQVDATRTFVRYAYRVERVDDIDWLPEPSAAEVAARDRLRRTYRFVIGPPAAGEAPGGWRLTLWTVDDRALVEHTVTVTRDGRVSDAARTVEPALPVPSSR